MSQSSLTRRHLLKSLAALGLAVPVLAACGAPSGGASSPGAAGSAAAPTTNAGGATAAPTAGASDQRATQAPQSQAVPSGGNVALSIATYAGPPRDWQRVAAKDWSQKNPNVKLTIDEVVYADAPKKQLAQLATNTMPDVYYNGIKWFSYSCAKGAFQPINDFVKANDPGLNDFLGVAIDGASFDGKLYGLPYLIHPGNPALVMFNKDLLQEKGATIPTDDWNVDDFVKLTTKLTDVKNKLWGTNYFPNTYYDFCSLARTWGGDDLSADGKKFTLATDPKSVDAAQWAVNLRAKSKIAPPETDANNLDTMFPSKQLATAEASIANFARLGATVGDKFKWDVVLFPKGPTGLRGYQGFVECFAIYSKSKQPETAYDLVVAETSKETGVMAVVKYDYQPSGRKSVWSSPEVTRKNSVYERALTWMNDTKGPFPMPYNLRYTELEDKWENTSKALFYGDIDFKKGMDQVQQACQAIMDLPRP